MRPLTQSYHARYPWKGIDKKNATVLFNFSQKHILKVNRHKIPRRESNTSTFQFLLSSIASLATGDASLLFLVQLSCVGK